MPGHIVEKVNLSGFELTFMATITDRGELTKRLNKTIIGLSQRSRRDHTSISVIFDVSSFNLKLFFIKESTLTVKELCIISNPESSLYIFQLA